MAIAIPNTRWSEVRGGDTLRIVALRELGDGMRWIEIARLNDLRPPYITPSTDPAERAPDTLIWGDRILLPRAPDLTPITALDEDLYGADLDLGDGLLRADEAGALRMKAGGRNLEDALIRRVRTPTGELMAHPRYGCDAAAVLGFKMREIAIVMAAGYVRGAVLADPRVESLVRFAVAAEGDALKIAASAKVVRQNLPLDANFVFPLER